MTRATSAVDQAAQTLREAAAEETIPGAPQKSGAGRDSQAGGDGGRSGSLAFAAALNRPGS